MGVGLPSSITTRYTRPVTSIADIEALERLTYDPVIPARNLYHLFEATARLHPDRLALTVLTKSSREFDGVSLTHRELLVEIFRTANLFRSLGITPGGPTVAILCPILPLTSRSKRTISSTPLFGSQWTHAIRHEQRN